MTRLNPRGRAQQEHWDARLSKHSVVHVLSNPKRFKHRFTKRQWAILNAAYHFRADGTIYPHTNKEVADALQLDTSLVRQDREAAERNAYELTYRWETAVDRWLRRLPLTRDHKRLLRKHALTKKGRAPAPELGTIREPGSAREARDKDAVPGWAQIETGRKTEDEIFGEDFN
jgi:DNA-binding PadR family transcriptional regulator